MNRVLPIAAAVALLVAGCGGGSEETAPQDAAAQLHPVAESPSDLHVRRADRICAEMVADAHRMGARFRKIPKVEINALTLTTQELVKPALPILEASARRLRALQPDAASLKFDSYVTLFDPIVSIVRNRVEAGEAGDSARAHELELLMVDLANLQRRLAREAGLKTCDVDFIETFSSGGGPS
jgi:hypothetical protein